MTSKTLHIVFVTDAWFPQVNGVVRTISNVKKFLEKCTCQNDDNYDEGETDCGVGNVYCRGCKSIKKYKVHVIDPSCFSFTVSMPFYEEIKLALDLWRFPLLLEAIKPNAIHIFTEGPIGIAARVYLSQKSSLIPFTTSYHTRFPEYFESYSHTSTRDTYRFLCWFHGPARGTLVPTAGILDQLKVEFSSEYVLNSTWLQSSASSIKAPNLLVWTRGVDRKQFHGDLRDAAFSELPHLKNVAKPIILCVSRVAQEKNIKTFCEIPSEMGTKILVGDGPLFSEIKRTYENDKSIIFTGTLLGRDLALYYALADVFVFPSLLDTFGNTMIEAMACGTPVAAYYVTGPKDVIEEGKTGVFAPLDQGEVQKALEYGKAGDVEKLCIAVKKALEIPRDVVLAGSERWTIESCVQIFEENLSFTDYWNTHLLPKNVDTGTLYKRFLVKLKDFLLGFEFMLEFIVTMASIVLTVFTAFVLSNPRQKKVSNK